MTRGNLNFLPKNIGKQYIRASYSNADFIVEAIRRRIDELEDICEYIPVSREVYEELNKVLDETGAPYRDTVDFVQTEINNRL